MILKKLLERTALRRRTPATIKAVEPPVSERLLDQRLRNRIMEQLWASSDGAAGVAPRGAVEWFEGFFDFVPYEGVWPMLVEGGWPDRIGPVAKAALGLFCRRGRFSEEVEEESPSSPSPWPGCS